MLCVKFKHHKRETGKGSNKSWILFTFSRFTFSKWQMASSHYILWCSCVISYGWFPDSVKNPRLPKREKKKVIGISKSLQLWLEKRMKQFSEDTNDHQKLLCWTNIISPFPVGNAGDSLTGHSGYQFSTKDQDNDNYDGNCAQTYRGAWWYRKCHSSNLNGRYLHGSHPSYADGVNWYSWKGYYYSVARSEMKIRPVSF